MKDWQLHTLADYDDNGNLTRKLGGAIVGLDILPTMSQLNSIEVIPTDDEQMQDLDRDNKFVCLTMADRKVWLDRESALALIELLNVAVKASEAIINDRNR